MGGTNRVITENNAADKLTLTRSDPAGLRYSMQVKQITDKIYELLPDAFVDSFAYARQIDENFIKLGYGKGAVCTVYVSKSFSSIFAV